MFCFTITPFLRHDGLKKRREIEDRRSNVNEEED
jgi:hypothetical protein